MGGEMVNYHLKSGVYQLGDNGQAEGEKKDYPLYIGNSQE
jgi:hypothetical protein